MLEAVGLWMGLNPSGTETRMFRENQLNTMVVDALALCVTILSAALVLDIQNKQALLFYEEGFQLPASSQCGEILENSIYFQFALR